MVILLVLLASACRPSNGSEEVDRVHNLIAKSVHIGDREERLISFFKAQGWDYTFDKWKSSYLTGIDVMEHGETPKYTITVQVVVTDTKRVKEYHVRAAWK